MERHPFTTQFQYALRVSYAVRELREEKIKITITITNPLSDQARALANDFNLPIFDNDAKTVHIYSITEPKGDEDEENGQTRIPETEAPDVE